MTEKQAEATRRRILIVEDDPDTVELLDEQLEGLGYDLRFAANGEEAILTTGEHTPPDLVVMDYMMPRLDGPETTRFFKARFVGHFVPVMMLSAKGDSGSVAEGIRMGADEYTTKPYETRVLLDRIAGLLAMRDAEMAYLQAPEGEEQAQAAAALVELRLRMARGFCDRGLYELARRYVARNTEVVPDHGPSLELLATIAGRD